MSVDIRFTEDIHQTILAAVEANEDALAAGLIHSDPLRKRACRQGFRAALSTVALALGLPPLPLADAEEQCSILDSAVSTSELRPLGDGRALVLSATGEEALHGDGSALVR